MITKQNIASQFKQFKRLHKHEANYIGIPMFAFLSHAGYMRPWKANTRRITPGGLDQRPAFGDVFRLHGYKAVITDGDRIAAGYKEDFAHANAGGTVPRAKPDVPSGNWGDRPYTKSGKTIQDLMGGCGSEPYVMDVDMEKSLDKLLDQVPWVLRRYNEAIALDYVIPFRLITPEQRSGGEFQPLIHYCQDSGSLECVWRADVYATLRKGPFVLHKSQANGDVVGVTIHGLSKRIEMDILNDENTGDGQDVR